MAKTGKDIPAGSLAQAELEEDLMGRKGCDPGVTSLALHVHGFSGASAREKRMMKTLGLD